MRRTLPMLSLRCKRWWLVVVHPGMLARHVPHSLVRHQEVTTQPRVDGLLRVSIQLVVSIQWLRQMQLVPVGHRELRALRRHASSSDVLVRSRSLHARIHDHLPLLRALIVLLTMT